MEHRCAARKSRSEYRKQEKLHVVILEKKEAGKKTLVDHGMKYSISYLSITSRYKHSKVKKQKAGLHDSYESATGTGFS